MAEEEEEGGGVRGGRTVTGRTMERMMGGARGVFFNQAASTAPTPETETCPKQRKQPAAQNTAHNNQRLFGW